MTDVEIQEVVVALQKCVGRLGEARSVVQNRKKQEEDAHPANKTLFFMLSDAENICVQAGYDISEIITDLEDYIDDNN